MSEATYVINAAVEAELVTLRCSLSVTLEEAMGISARTADNYWT